MVDKEIKTDIKDMNLSDIADGTIRFSIKAKDTDSNRKIHVAFKEFSEIEADNNYTLALGKLLEAYQSDFKYESLFDMLQEQKVALADLKACIVELKKKPQQEDEESSAF